MDTAEAGSALRDLAGIDMSTLLDEAALRETAAPLRSRYGGVWRLDPSLPTKTVSAPDPVQSAIPPIASPPVADPPDAALDAALDWLPQDDVDDAPAGVIDPGVKPRARWLGLVLAAGSALAVMAGVAAMLH